MRCTRSFVFARLRHNQLSLTHRCSPRGVRRLGRECSTFESSGALGRGGRFCRCRLSRCLGVGRCIASFGRIGTDDETHGGCYCLFGRIRVVAGAAQPPPSRIPEAAQPPSSHHQGLPRHPPLTSLGPRSPLRPSHNPRAAQPPSNRHVNPRISNSWSRILSRPCRLRRSPGRLLARRGSRCSRRRLTSWSRRCSRTVALSFSGQYLWGLHSAI